jgi:hypothetical protein
MVWNSSRLTEFTEDIREFLEQRIEVEKKDVGMVVGPLTANTPIDFPGALTLVIQW